MVYKCGEVRKQKDEAHCALATQNALCKRGWEERWVWNGVQCGSRRMRHRIITLRPLKSLCAVRNKWVWGSEGWKDEDATCTSRSKRSAQVRVGDDRCGEAWKSVWCESRWTRCIAIAPLTASCVHAIVCGRGKALGGVNQEDEVQCPVSILSHSPHTSWPPSHPISNPAGPYTCYAAMPCHTSHTASHTAPTPGP